MADIMKDNADTYIKDLILEEFESNSNEDKILSDTSTLDTNERQNTQADP